MKREKRAICGICPAGCWVIVTYDSKGRLSEVRADKSSPLGSICRLGEHSAEIVYSPDRLLYPLKRSGPKGTHEFERISWDDAYEIISNRLHEIKDTYGAEATSVYTGRGSFELAMCDVFQPKGVAVSSASSVLFPFGSPNTMGVGALCYVSFAMIAPHVTMGGMMTTMFSDIENADLIVVWGANPATDSPPQDLGRIRDAHDRGARVIVIDPRRTMTAKLTDAEWVPIRPGTDGALALGMCNVIIKEDLHDESFVKNWTRGFDEFARYVQHFSPEAVESITGVPADTIRSIARRIAEAVGASPVMYSGLEYSDSGVQAIRATKVLWALAGQLDVPGGRCFTMKENHFPVNRQAHVANPDPRKALGRDRFPIYSMYRGESHAMALPEAVLQGRPYPIRSLIILGGSIITAWPEPALWKDTLNSLDLLVCIDRQLTADSAYADIVLPATTMYEIESYMTYGPVFRVREKVIDPPGEARNDFLIMAELAKQLGYGDRYPQSSEALLRHVLQGSGFTLEEVVRSGGTVGVTPVMMQYRKWEKGLLRRDGMPGFDTPSGKFEIASVILEEHGYDPLPVYSEPSESPLSRPDLARDFPLVFNSGARVTTDFRSQHHGIPGLNRDRPEPTVTINTRDAESRGIGNGDLVQLRSSRGAVIMRALVTDDMVQGAVDANMGGGGPVGPDAWQKCNINELTALSRYDPISGFPVYKALLCDVVKMRTGVPESGPDSGESTSSVTEVKTVKVLSPEVSRIYLDHNATTPLDPEVREAMLTIMRECPGNPSSIYHEGRKAKFAVDSARRGIARLIGCTARRVIFTGSGSEANNLVIKGIAFAGRRDKDHIITSSVEHPSVSDSCRWLEQQGCKVTFLPVDSVGRVDPAELDAVMTRSTSLVTIMTANNETGTIQPVSALAEIARKHNVPFHTDATQAVGKIPVDVDELGLDFLTMSAHKIYGPKGVGAVFIRKGLEIDSIIHGGSQESGARAGTENVSGIVGLGKAAELAVRYLSRMDRVRALRDRLEGHIRQLIPDCRLNGDRDDRLPNTLSLVIPGMRGESVVMALDQKGVGISSGSACRSGSPRPSQTLLAMGLSEEDAHCTVRISLGLGTTDEEIARTAALLDAVITETKNAVRFSPCR